MLIKAGGSSGGIGSSGMPTEGRFTYNAEYICTYTGNYLISCIGGGGAGGSCYDYNSKNEWDIGGSGGGSGYVNQKTIRMNAGDRYEMTIGAGGVGGINVAGGSGGTTSFGTLVSAAGGGGGPIYTSWKNANIAVGGAGFSNGYPRWYANNGKYSYGYGGAIAINYKDKNNIFSLTNVYLGTGSVLDDYNCIRIMYGDGGQGMEAANIANATPRYAGGNGTKGCIFVNFIN